jgi:hypothetical protein
VAPPSVGGPLIAGQTVTPVAGTWSGGWTGDFDWLQLAVCASADGSDCQGLTDPPHGASGSAELPPCSAGEYVRVADEVEGPGTGVLTYGIGSTSADAWYAVWPDTGSDMQIAIVGPIGPADGQIPPVTGVDAWRCPQLAAPPAPAPPSTPTVAPTVPTSTTQTAATPHPSTSATDCKGGACTSTGRAHISAGGVVTVKCARSCPVIVRATRGKRHARLSRVLAGGGSVSIRLPKGTIARLGDGSTRLTVTVGGVRAANRLVRLR